ncbi:MAG: DUF1656 domain-containing protein [Leptospirales bacterium]
MKEVNFFGIFLSPLLVWSLLAYFLLVAVRAGLGHFGLYRFIWHRSLFDLSLFILILALVVMIVMV